MSKMLMMVVLTVVVSVSTLSFGIANAAGMMEHHAMKKHLMMKRHMAMKQTMMQHRTIRHEM